MPHRFFINRLGLAAAIGLAIACAPAPAMGQDDKNPQKTFDDVFGENYRRAIATASTEDDTALANDLSKAVLTIDMPVSLMQVIADRLGTLAEKSVAAALPAAAALEKLAQSDPQKKALHNSKIVALLERAHAGGDADTRNVAAVKLVARLVPLADQELADRKLDAAVDHYRKALKLARDLDLPDVGAITSKFNAASDQQKRYSEIDALEKRIEANANDVEARKRLIQIHLVENDDASAAIWFAGEGIDETTRRLLPIAAKDGNGAEPKTLAELGEWYDALADTAPAATKLKMLTRAKTYFDRFLADYKQNDLLKAKVTLTLEQIDKKLKALETATVIKPPATGTTTTDPPAAVNTPPTTPATTGPGALTVEIQGPTVTDPERIERMYQQYWRRLGAEYVVIGNDYAPALEYDPRYSSSAKETMAEVTRRLTVTKTERVGLIRKVTTVPPVPAEAQAVAMALPAFERGAYGYVHSAEVVEVLGPQEMVVRNVWLVDPQTLIGVRGDQRSERDKLRQRQDAFNSNRLTMRLCGYDTTAVKVGDRIGMIGANGGKPLQIMIVQTEPQPNTPGAPGAPGTPRPVATIIEKSTMGGIDEKQFADLLAKRGITHTDFVNIFLESQRTSLRDSIANTVQRIESKGAPLP